MRLHSRTGAYATLVLSIFQPRLLFSLALPRSCFSPSLSRSPQLTRSPVLVSPPRLGYSRSLTPNRRVFNQSTDLYSSLFLLSINTLSKEKLQVNRNYENDGHKSHEKKKRIPITIERKIHIHSRGSFFNNLQHFTSKYSLLVDPYYSIKSHPHSSTHSFSQRWIK